MPDRELLNIYQSVGGVKVTVGSDTHSLEELAKGYDYANNLIAGNLRSVVYVNRKPINL